MSEHQLIKRAEQCRVQARPVAKPESEGFETIPEGLQHIASIAEARRAIEETRCW